MPAPGVDLAADDAQVAAPLAQAAAADADAERLAAELPPLPAPADGAAAAEARRRGGGAAARLEASRRRRAATAGREAEALERSEFDEQVAAMLLPLRTLYVSADGDAVAAQGAARARLSGDELLTTELIVGGTFNNLTAAQSAALCSCLIAPQVEKVKRPPPLPPELCDAVGELQQHATRLAAAYADAGVAPSQYGGDEIKYVAQYSNGMVAMVLAWCTGAPFSDLCEMVDLFEGSIVRAVRRLRELLDELKSAAKAIGNDELYAKFGDACDLVQRDIIFVNSLYTA